MLHHYIELKDMVHMAMEVKYQLKKEQKFKAKLKL